MTMPTPFESPPAEKPPRSVRRFVLGCGVVSGVLLLLVVLTAAVTWTMASRRANEQLAIQVAKVRARGEPLTTVELNDFYQPARNRPDMTEEIMAALAECEAADLKILAEKLPIVGQGDEPPPLPQEWPQLADVEAYLGRQTSAIATFNEVARLDGTARFLVDFSPGIATLLPHVQSMRRGARVLSLQFHVNLHRGRTSDAVECILAQLALAIDRSTRSRRSFRSLSTWQLSQWPWETRKPWCNRSRFPMPTSFGCK